MTQVKVVRIYLSEDSPEVNTIFDFLHEHKIRGATIFRGVKGFGHSGVTREARVLDMHFALPIVLEFFDEPKRVDEVIKKFSDKVESGCMLHWLADVNDD